MRANGCVVLMEPAVLVSLDGMGTAGEEKTWGVCCCYIMGSMSRQGCRSVGFLQGWFCCRGLGFNCWSGHARDVRNGSPRTIVLLVTGYLRHE